MSDDLPPRHHRGRQAGIAVVGVAVLAGIIMAANHHGKEKPKTAGPIPVSVTKARVQDMEVWKAGVGSVTPIEVVDVKARVDGQIMRILFQEGDQVAQGQVLAQIDPRPYRAAYEQAVANRNRDAAQLANTHLDLDRATKLAALGAGTSQNVDTLKAQAAAQAASVAADQAAADSAKLNLEWTTIRSPIAGRAGLRQANLGAMVHANDAAGVVTITQLSPIAVLFSLPQNAVSALIGPSAGPAAVVVDDQSGATSLARGTLQTIDSQVDSANGQIKLKARFDNSDHRLWPGTLVSARVLATTIAHAMTVPADALQQGQTGTFVYVVDKKDEVAERPIKVGPTTEGNVVVLSGLHEGENVVVSGQSRIAAGSHVKPHPYRPPS